MAGIDDVHSEIKCSEGVWVYDLDVRAATDASGMFLEFRSKDPGDKVDAGDLSGPQVSDESLRVGGETSQPLVSGAAAFGGFCGRRDIPGARAAASPDA